MRIGPRLVLPVFTLPVVLGGMLAASGPRPRPRRRRAKPMKSLSDGEHGTRCKKWHRPHHHKYWVQGCASVTVHRTNILRGRGTSYATHSHNAYVRIGWIKLIYQWNVVETKHSKWFHRGGDHILRTPKDHAWVGNYWSKERVAIKWTIHGKIHRHTIKSHHICIGGCG